MRLLAMQDATLWERALDRYGLAVVILCLLGLFFYKAAWPWWVERQKKADDFLKEQIADAKKLMAEQVSAARDARREDQAEFLKALERKDTVTREQTEAIKQLAEKIDEVRR